MSGMRRLTEAQWDVLARAVAQAEADWDADGGASFRRDTATLDRAWDRLCQARNARLV